MMLNAQPEFDPTIYNPIDPSPSPPARPFEPITGRHLSRGRDRSKRKNAILPAKHTTIRGLSGINPASVAENIRIAQTLGHSMVCKDDPIPIFGGTLTSCSVDGGPYNYQPSDPPDAHYIAMQMDTITRLNRVEAQGGVNPSFPSYMAPQMVAPNPTHIATPITQAMTTKPNQTVPPNPQPGETPTTHTNPLVDLAASTGMSTTTLLLIAGAAAVGLFMMTRKGA